jgi:hypothetical protein
MGNNRSMLEVCEPIKNRRCRPQEAELPCHGPGCGRIQGWLRGCRGEMGAN